MIDKSELTKLQLRQSFANSLFFLKK